MLPVFAMLYRTVKGERVPVASVVGAATMLNGNFDTFLTEQTEDVEIADTIEICGYLYEKSAELDNKSLVSTIDGDPPRERVRGAKLVKLLQK